MPARFGAFGKISGMGDFLRLNLPAEFVRPWDDWLQTQLVSARQALGQAWEDRYLSAPIWRFSLPGGVVGRQGASGILMASVDRVGRHYPLTIVACGASGATALRHFANCDVLSRIEDIALATLEDGASRRDLEDALQGLNLATPSETAAPGEIYAGPLPPVQVLAAQAIGARRGDVAIWTTQIEDDHRMMLTPALPDPRQFTALFDLDATLWRGGRVTQPA